MSIFENIKVGDKVVRTQPYGSRSVVEVVTHVTPTRFAVGFIVYIKKDGREHGGGNHSTWAIRIATDDDIAKQRRVCARDRIKLDGLLTDEQLDAFADLFEKCGVKL